MWKRTFMISFTSIVGTMMVLMWSFFLISGSVPELETDPFEIILHITAELLTGILLILSSLTIMKERPISRLFLPISLGMLTYTIIVSPGYYADRGEWPFVIMFTFLFLMTVFAIYLTSTEISGRKVPFSRDIGTG